MQQRKRLPPRRDGTTVETRLGQNGGYEFTNYGLVVDYQNAFIGHRGKRYSAMALTVVSSILSTSARMAREIWHVTPVNGCAASIQIGRAAWKNYIPVCRAVVSYTHLRAHETDSYLVCRLLLEKK